MKKSLFLMLFGALFTMAAQAQTKVVSTANISEQSTALTRQMMADLELGENKYMQLKTINARHLEALSKNTDPAAETARYEAALAEVLSPEQMEQYRQSQQSGTPR